MAARKPCIEDRCSKPAEGPRCPDHQRAWEAARGSRHDRGYDDRHERARARMMRAWALAVRRGQTWFCPRCQQPLIQGQFVDADHYGETLHQSPDAVADRLSHRACNRGARPAAGQGDTRAWAQ